MSLSKEEAKTQIDQLKNQLAEIYDSISELAVEHKILTYIDGPAYGMGGSVVLVDFTSGGGWGDKFEAGEWLASSQNGC